jgi:hypothetical protein
MKRAKRIFRVVSFLGLGVASLLLLAWGRGHQSDTVLVTGTVLDPDSAQPLSGVEVSWRSQRVTTDRSGHYEIGLPVGIRKLSISGTHRPAVKKSLIIQEAGVSLIQDVVLPGSPRALQKVLVLNRGTRAGRALRSDVPVTSTISLTDAYGNQDEFLAMNTGAYGVHSPIWLNPTTLAFAKQGIVHDPSHSNQMGVFEYQTGSPRIQQIAADLGAKFLSKAPERDALVLATSKELYVLDTITKSASPRRIFKLDPEKGFILSVAWAFDDRIYFTVDDSIPLDDRHYFTRSRITSIRPDGEDLDSSWAADLNYSFRYPVAAKDGEILFSRFSLDGNQKTLCSRKLETGKTMPLIEPALRAVQLDKGGSRLYYIYRHSLHLRDLQTGADWVIVNSVEEADYLQ